MYNVHNRSKYFDLKLRKDPNQHDWIHQKPIEQYYGLHAILPRIEI